MLDATANDSAADVITPVSLFHHSVDDERNLYISIHLITVENPEEASSDTQYIISFVKNCITAHAEEISFAKQASLMKGILLQRGLLAATS
ncbi:hypothetical protein JTB14_018765 [Gonioctena quinquepunctata]|nr:hypothetical protein JTB14_018765 [Gonioctena quinquepunctata]